jgi:lipoate-protein ligase A
MVETWRLLDLDALEPLKAQTLYEAVAAAVDRGSSPNTIILCHPANPYVCIGFHQELEKEVDAEFCQSRQLPIIRRSQGGGAVYLDSWQQFYQIVAREDSPIVPFRVDQFFEKFLEPTVYVCQKLGLPAKYKPINDVVVNGRKISGNGAGKIGKAAILVGNIILDLDYDLMARVLKVPSEKFRDKLAQTIKEWVTSLKRELGYVPARTHVKRLLVEGYEKIGIKLVRGSISQDEENIFLNEVMRRHTSREWLYMPQFRHPELCEKRAVKVAGDVKVVEGLYKAKKMIRVTAELVSGKINDIMLSGDFFMIPENALPELEKQLVGVQLSYDEILRKVSKFYEEFKVQVPGVEPEDFAEAITKALAAEA